jgi:hypothetical protein
MSLQQDKDLRIHGNLVLPDTEPIHPLTVQMGSTICCMAMVPGKRIPIAASPDDCDEAGKK